METLTHEESSTAPAASDAGSAAGAADRTLPVLDATEARVLGTLIEKALTTPEQYPMSLNGLTLGCNQKSNRDPVLDLAEHDVGEATARLRHKGLCTIVRLAGSRVDKYRQHVRETLHVSVVEMAVLAELLLRGPQTPGELRPRVSRMQDVKTVDEMEAILVPMQERGLIRKVPPASGSRTWRFLQLLAPDSHKVELAGSPAEPPPARVLKDAPALTTRVETLEAEVKALKETVAVLAARLGVSVASGARAEEAGA